MFGRWQQKVNSGPQGQRAAAAGPASHGRGSGRDPLHLIQV